MPFWRDNSGRLTIDFKLEAQQYPALCRRIADEFDLIPAGELVVGIDEMFWNYQRGDQEIGLEWDIWTGFMARGPIR